jgi:hypothetical protein
MSGKGQPESQTSWAQIAKGVLSPTTHPAMGVQQERGGLSVRKSSRPTAEATNRKFLHVPATNEAYRTEPAGTRDTDNFAAKTFGTRMSNTRIDLLDSAIAGARSILIGSLRRATKRTPGLGDVAMNGKNFQLLQGGSSHPLSGLTPLTHINGNSYRTKGRQYSRAQLVSEQKVGGSRHGHEIYRGVSMINVEDEMSYAD